MNNLNFEFRPFNTKVSFAFNRLNKEINNFTGTGIQEICQNQEIMFMVTAQPSPISPLWVKGEHDWTKEKGG